MCLRESRYGDMRHGLGRLREWIPYADGHTVIPPATPYENSGETPKNSYFKKKPDCSG